MVHVSNAPCISAITMACRRRSSSSHFYTVPSKGKKTFHRSGSPGTCPRKTTSMSVASQSAENRSEAHSSPNNLVGTRSVCANMAPSASISWEPAVSAGSVCLVGSAITRVGMLMTGLADSEHATSWTVATWWKIGSTRRLQNPTLAMDLATREMEKQRLGLSSPEV